MEYNYIYIYIQINVAKLNDYTSIIEKQNEHY